MRQHLSEERLPAKMNSECFLPSLFRITEADPNFPWERIDRQFTTFLGQKLKNSDKEKLTGSDYSITLEACLFLVMIQARKGSRSAFEMLDYLNRLLSDLHANMAYGRLPLLSRIVKSLMVNFDLKFLNFVGELAVLNALLKGGVYELEGIEFGEKAMPTIDFKMKNLEDDLIDLVEVLNIQICSSKVEQSDDAIFKFLSFRFNNKIEKKLNYLSAADYTFTLVPVLWGSPSEIKIYSDFFKRNKVDFLGCQCVHEPFAYLKHSNGAELIHQFSRVSKLKFDI